MSAAEQSLKSKYAALKAKKAASGNPSTNVNPISANTTKPISNNNASANIHKPIIAKNSVSNNPTNSNLPGIIPQQPPPNRPNNNPIKRKKKNDTTSDITTSAAANPAINSIQPNIDTSNNNINNSHSPARPTESNSINDTHNSNQVPSTKHKFVPAGTNTTIAAASTLKIPKRSVAAALLDETMKEKEESNNEMQQDNTNANNNDSNSQKQHTSAYEYVEENGIKKTQKQFSNYLETLFLMEKDSLLKKTMEEHSAFLLQKACSFKPFLIMKVKY